MAPAPGPSAAPRPLPRSRPAPPPPLAVVCRRQGVLWALGAVAAWAPLVGWTIATLDTLCHELGHAAAGWLFARPAVPAFDFSHGGGVTTIGERWGLLVVLLSIAWTWAAWNARHRQPALIAVLAAAGAWALVMATGLDEPLTVAMGHGGVLALSAVFLARGLSGLAVAHAGERALYALVGWAMWWREAGFAWGLLHDGEDRERYLEGKRGIDNDLLRLAQDHLSWSLEAVAWWHLFAIAITPVTVGWWFLRWRRAQAAGQERG